MLCFGFLLLLFVWWGFFACYFGGIFLFVNLLCFGWLGFFVGLERGLAFFFFCLWVWGRGAGGFLLLYLLGSFSSSNHHVQIREKSLVLL